MIYISNQLKNIFLVNFKVCYTTFQLLLYKNIVNIINDIDFSLYQDYEIYIIVRNPINRIESFYRDKILSVLRKEKKITQDSIKLMLDYFDEDYLLNNFTISDLCNIIKKKYTEIHICCQSDIYKYVLNKINNKKINIVKLEDKDFTPFVI